MVLIKTFWLESKYVMCIMHMHACILSLRQFAHYKFSIYTKMLERSSFSVGTIFLDRMKNRVAIHSLLDFKKKGAVEGEIDKLLVKKQRRKRNKS